MQTTKFPINVCDELDKIGRNFIWGHVGDSRKVHLISWDVLCKPKSYGGLGLRSFRNVNSATLAKLDWRFLTEQDKLWVQVLKTKYGKRCSRLDMLSLTPGASNIWQGMIHAVPVLHKVFLFDVVNGSSTRFWQDT
ncbi:hypothetical protein DITRI_Ditri01bG0100600 [Diplodiscus trichospermus]